MSLTVITVINQETNVVSTLASVLESTYKPHTYCVVIGKECSDKTKESVLVLFKGCCGVETKQTTEDSGIVYETNLNGVNLICVLSNLENSNVKGLYSLAISKTVDFSKNYVILNQGVSISENGLRLLDDKLSNPVIGFVYSDYIQNNVYRYVGNFHYLIRNKVNIVSYGLKASLINETLKIDPFDIASTVYNTAIVSKIPQPVFAL